MFEAVEGAEDDEAAGSGPLTLAIDLNDADGGAESPAAPAAA